jgi:hypothetical protein
MGPRRSSRSDMKVMLINDFDDRDTHTDKQGKIQAPGNQSHGPGRGGDAQTCQSTIARPWETM